MNKKNIIALLMLSTTVLSSAGSIGAQAAAIKNEPKLTQKSDQTQESLVPDANLRKALIGSTDADGTVVIASESDITKENLAKIKVLDVHNKNISSIEGIQYCKNLQTLDIGTKTGSGDEDNTISDLTPLESLTNLTQLGAGKLHITNFAPLKSLPLSYTMSSLAPKNNTFLGDQSIKIQAKANKDGSYTFHNPCVDIDGTPMLPSKTDGGNYDTETNTMSWKDVKQNHPHFGDEYSIQMKFQSNKKESDEDDAYPTVYFDLEIEVQTPAEWALDEANALFENNDPELWTLADGVTSTQIQTAYDDANALSDTDGVNVNGIFKKKDYILKIIDKADVEFQINNDLNKIFLDGDITSNQLAPGVTQDEIDTAKSDIMKMSDCPKKTQLLVVVKTAQMLFDESSQKEVKVSYDYTAPTPADPGWYSVVPADVAFTDQNKDVDTSVKLVNADDQATLYTGEKSVAVTVQSVNGYKLKDQAVPEADVAYKLDKDGKNTTFFEANDTVQDLGVLDKTTNKLESKAHLTGTATKTGKYIDTLHYVFAETD